MTPTPEDGDVIVRLTHSDGAAVYVLHVAPHADQISLRSRDKAIAHVIAFARHVRVRAWLDEGAPAPLLLEDCRDEEAV